MAQLVLNNRTATITENSAFYANFGQYPNLFKVLRKSSQTEATLQKITQLKEIYKKILRNIKY